MILSYYGSNDEVYELMRRASHKTRAYITNAGGLKGFLVPFSVSSVLRTLAKNVNGELTKLQKYHQFSISSLINQVEKMKTNDQRAELLKVEYPSLYIHYLKKIGTRSDAKKLLENYKIYCKQFYDDPNRFSLYLHGWFFPWLQEQRDAGKLVQGETVI